VAVIRRWRKRELSTALGDKIGPASSVPVDAMVTVTGLKRD